MSNLVKQYYVVQPNSKTRIINYNKKIEERVYENSQLYPSEVQTDDITMPEGQPAADNAFVDGILADVVSETNVPEKADDILENAQKQADDILNNARTEAEDIILKAKEKAELIFKEKREEGYNTGLEDKREQLEKREKQIEMDIASKRSELEREFKQYSDELESDIIDAVIKVFNKVFHIQFDDKKDMLLHLVKNTISKIEVGKEFRIHVSQANYKFLIAHLGEIRERIGNDIDVEVVNDAKLDSSDCRIETSFGVFDCGIDMELNNLVKDIKSLCNG